jgi:competence protein ComGC
VSTPIPGSSPLMGGFIARLSQRERVLLGMLLLVFFVISVSVLFMLRSTAMAEKQKSIDELRRGLDLVYTRGTVYDLKKKEKAAREARIASIQPLIYSSLLEEAQKSLTNGTVRGEEEKPSVEVVPGVLTKRLYGFEVKGVALEELLNFLTKLEQDPGHFLIVERLAIKSPSALEDRLNVEVELATWEMLKKPPEGEAAAEGSEP